MAKKNKEPSVAEVPHIEFAAFYICEASDPLENRFGAGVHGYLSTQVMAKRGYGLKGMVPSPTGYVEGKNEDLRVIHSVVDIRQPLYREQDRATVANCLLAGCVSALEFVQQLDELPKTVCLLLPRRNLVQFLSKGYAKCIEDGYQDNKGAPIPFRELLDAYLRLVEILKAKGTSLTLQYASPDTRMGLPEALSLAQDAVTAVAKAKGTEAEPSCVVSPPEGYWNHDHGRHPLLTKSRMVFRMLKGQVVEHDHLYLMDFEKGSKKKEQLHKLEIEVGQLLPSASYGVVKIREIDPIIYRVAQEHATYLDAQYERLAVLFLDAVFKPGAHSVMSKVGADYLYSRTVVTDLLDSQGTMYSHELNPARQAYRAWNTYLDMEALLKEFMKLSTHPEDGLCVDFQDARGVHTATNITSRFIEVKEDAKGKRSYRPTRDIETPATQVRVRGFYMDEGGETREADINLSIGIDMPKRNAIAGFASERTRAYLLLRQDTAFTLRHFVVITNGDEYGIWTAPFANRTFVNSSR